MHKIKYQEADSVLINNEIANGINARVVIGKANGACNFCMRVFEVASGGHTPKHTHAWEHEIFVHSGAGEIFGNQEWNSFKTGDVVFVPGNEEHQIRNTGSGTLTFICLVPSSAPEL
ncbi:MAG: cupin domain-containing protein [Geobacteraceae bacterium]|nr:cupin domain-containing protein [Geobacteraceae bacterium]